MFWIEEHDRERAKTYSYELAFDEYKSQIAALERQVTTMREALRTANIELAALVPKPSEATPKDWPCENPADRECLQSAFEVIRRALAREGGEGE